MARMRGLRRPPTRPRPRADRPRRHACTRGKRPAPTRHPTDRAAAGARLHRRDRVDTRPRGSAARSTRSSPISAGCSGSTRSPASTTTTPAPGAIRRRTASATPSRSRSGSTTTGSSGLTERGRETCAGPRWSSAPVLSRADVELPASPPFSGDPFDIRTGFLLPASSRHVAHAPFLTSLTRRRSSRRPSALRSPVSTSQATTTRSGGGAAPPKRRLRLSQAFRPRCSHPCVVAARSRTTTSPARSPSSSSTHIANAPIDRYARGEPERNDSIGETRRDPVLRRGKLRLLPLRLRARTRCSATFAST